MMKRDEPTGKEIEKNADKTDTETGEKHLSQTREFFSRCQIDHVMAFGD